LSTEDVLSEIDVRVLGALMEKEMSTPEYYPLSLNALVNACNQSSNRDPVVKYDDAMVMQSIDGLRRRGLVRAIQKSDSRVSKYSQLLSVKKELTAQESAVLCELLLRGAQTPGELKSRASRLTSFDTLEQVEAALNALIQHGSPLAVRLERRPGQKEARFAHLLAGEPTAESIDGTSRSRGESDRIIALEQSVEELRQELADLRSRLDEFQKQFE
jgi:uncharacterized protein YceH (UPF0502 family)